MWREVAKTESDLLLTASRFEREFPTFYRDTLNVRTVDEADMLAYYANCQHLFGIFDDRATNELIGLLYCERLNDTHSCFHLDMKRGAEKPPIFMAACGVRDLVFANGLQIGEAWALKRNRPLQHMLGNVGFVPSGLELRNGTSHGKSLRWAQWIIKKETYDQSEN